LPCESLKFCKQHKTRPQNFRAQTFLDDDIQKNPLTFPVVMSHQKSLNPKDPRFF